MKKAFTLIELLVVIAIIAILAAILFPVFAQAKLAAKKTTDLSNLKQMATSALIYVNDSDDVFPLTVPGNDGVSYFTMPATRATINNQASLGVRSSFWGNSLQAYIKNYQLYYGAANSDKYEPLGVQSPAPVVDYGYDLNPYLNAWSGTASQAPAKAVMFYNGHGNVRIPGYGISYPLIVVQGIGFLAGQNPNTAWTFQSTGSSCVIDVGYFGGTLAGSGVGSVWKFNAFGNGANISYLDGHGKFAKFGSTDFPYKLNANGTYNTHWKPTGTACTYAYTLAPDIAQ